MKKPKIVCIVGATASGKTAVSVQLARMLDTEIISADSIQVYRGLDIGSAKPTDAEKCGIVHHLMDCIDIYSPNYSVSEYKELASKAVYDISGRGKIPIVIGGTGLYINSLTFPLSFAQVKPNAQLRAKLCSLEEQNPGLLHKMLEEIDPLTAQRLHKNDTKRLVRAIEVYKLSGKPLSEHGNDFKNENGEEIEFDPIMIGITMPRDILYERIEKRVDIMMQQGLLDEVKHIMSLPQFSPDLPSMQGLGYKQIIEHILHGNPSTVEETVANIKLETRHFAKRQLTWFRRDKRIRWYDVTQYENKNAVASDIYGLIRGELNG